MLKQDMNKLDSIQRRFTKRLQKVSKFFV